MFNIKRGTPLIYISLLMLSCSKDAKTCERSEFYLNKNGYIVHLKDTNIKYNISSLEGKYKDAAKKALKEANRFTNLTFTSTNSNSNFVFKTCEGNIPDHPKANALNHYTYEQSSGVLKASEITISKSHCDAFSNEGLVYIFIHELGHTFGLRDLGSANDFYYDNTGNYYEDKSVMYGGYSEYSKYTFVSYQNFDQENIISYCGGNYN